MSTSATSEQMCISPHKSGFLNCWGFPIYGETVQLQMHVQKHVPEDSINSFFMCTICQACVQCSTIQSIFILPLVNMHLHTLMKSLTKVDHICKLGYRN